MDSSFRPCASLRKHSLVRKSASRSRLPSVFRPRGEVLEMRAMLTTSLSQGFVETTVATGISGPTAMDFSPDGRLWVLEQAGNVKLVHSDGSTFTALHLNVDSNGERGVLGIAFDPNFTTNHFVYVYYTNPSASPAPWSTGVHNQLSRFTVNDANPQQPTFINEAPILDWNTLSTATNHNGGAIHFGKDGMLYADAGDNLQTFTMNGGTFRVSQTLANLLGKQLRINVAAFNSGVATRDDTTVGHLIPADNPFVGTASGINQLIYVLGLRNPFTFAVQPGTGRILVNDVGENTWEEIDDSVAGGNYGWSGGNTDGFGQTPPSFAPGTYHDPLLAYAHSGTASLATGSAIVGGTFYNPSTVQFPSSYVGMYFYEDLSTGFIRYFNPNTPNVAATPDGNSVAFASGTPGGLRDLKVDAAGNLYYLSGGDGSIRKISYVAPKISLTVGSGAPNFSTTWYNNGPVPIANNALATIATASAVPTLTSLVVTLATFHTGDVLNVPILSGVSITSSFAAGTLTLSGTDTLAHYQQELRFVNYNNTAGGLGVTPITATFVANDGTNLGTPVTSTINIKLASGQVLGNRLFYNNSIYDGNNAAIGSADDAAIASDKTGFNGTSTATFANVSAFNKGITGIMVDLASGLGTHSAINLTSGDITFKVSPAAFVATSYNQLSTWSAASTPSAISVRLGSGVGGSDRLEITWATGAIKNQWLEVDVHSAGHTGLAADDVFYFGSQIGDSGVADTALLAKTDGNDYNVPFNNIVGLTTPVWNLADYAKDGKTDGNDATAAISNISSLHYLANPTGPFAAAIPAAAPTASASGTVSSGLSILNSGSINVPTWLSGRLQSILTSPPVTKAIQSDLHNPQILNAVEQVASKLHLNEDVLDGLLKDLGSQN